MLTFSLPDHRVRELILLELALLRSPVTTWRLTELVVGIDHWPQLDNAERLSFARRVRAIAQALPEVHSRREIGGRTYWSIKQLERSNGSAN